MWRLVLLPIPWLAANLIMADRGGGTSADLPAAETANLCTALTPWFCGPGSSLPANDVTQRDGPHALPDAEQATDTTTQEQVPCSRMTWYGYPSCTCLDFLELPRREIWVSVRKQGGVAGLWETVLTSPNSVINYIAEYCSHQNESQPFTPLECWLRETDLVLRIPSGMLDGSTLLRRLELTGSWAKNGLRRSSSAWRWHEQVSSRACLGHTAVMRKCQGTARPEIVRSLDRHRKVRLYK